MNTADYTSDAICRALGLPGFASDPTLAQPQATLRLLLKPSFHPEVCITLWERQDASTASVVAAREMVWHLPTPGPLLTDRETCTIPDGVVGRLTSRFAEVAADLKGLGIVIDGMPVDALMLQAKASPVLVTQNVGNHAEYASMVAATIEAVWNNLAGARCKNALAIAAKYAGLELPHLPEPEPKPNIRTMVLGSPEDRDELLEALRRRGDG